MSDAKFFNWRETVFRQYERPLDAAETFYALMAKTWEGTGRTFFAINASVDLIINDPRNEGEEISMDRIVPAFQHAWKKSRYQFPTIAAEVIVDHANKSCKKLYKIPADEKEVDDWINETLFVVENGLSAKDFANLDQPAGRFATLYLFPPVLQSSEEYSGTRSKRMSMLFKCRHDIIDGIGSLKLLNCIIKFAAAALISTTQSPAVLFGDEQKNLSPPLETAYGFREPDAKQLENFGAFNKCKANASMNREVAGFPGKITASKPGRSQQAGLKLSTQQTTKIIERCKAFKVTATHLFHAALALAIGSIQERMDDERKVLYITYALINLRGVCGQPPGNDLHPDSVLQTVSQSNLMVELNIPAKFAEPEGPPQDLLEVLHCVKDFYKSNILDDEFLDLVSEVYRSVTPQYPENTPTLPEPSPSRKVSLSSLGLINNLIESHHRSFTVANPCITAGEYSTGMGVFLGTFDGEISLNAAYNEAFYDELTVRNFLQKVKEFAIEIVEAMDAGEVVFCHK